ncbi:MAG: cell division protein FtsZ [Hyphomicrobium sp.]|nr:MAG: cell division protein FtsZ [Hyphomicrobium sp.]
MSIKLQLPKILDLRPRLTVVGVGGAGCNAVNNMIAAGLTGVEFIVANTDAQALAASSAEQRIQLGTNLTEGLGAGSKPEIGEAAAEEAIEEIRAHVAGSHMLFIAAGMGGGTGTGAAAVIARTAKELGVLTVGIVTKPFQFEGTRRQRIAEAGIAELKASVDTLIVIPNQNLFRIANDKTTFAEAFVLADQVLYSGVACIVDLIVKEGLINLDFADVRTIMSGMGTAMMGTGEAAGDRRAIMAAEEAIANPLLDDITLKGAKGLLLSITGGRDLTLYEVDEAASRVRQEVDPEANIIVGATFDESLGDRVRVSIVASGMARAGGDAGRSQSAADQVAWPKKPSAQPPPAQSPSQPNPPQAVQASASPYPALHPSTESQSARAARPDSHPQDLQRRLTNAMQSGPPGGAVVHPVSELTRGEAAQPYPGVMPHRHDPPRQSPGGGGQTWRAPGNVLIEEGAMPPYAADHAALGPASEVYGRELSGSGYDTGMHPDDFVPAPSAEIRRKSPRMPDLEEFPVVGQRDYRAKSDGLPPVRGTSDPSRSGWGGQSGQPVGQSIGRKPGLLQRLTGMGRRGNDLAADSDARSAYGAAARGAGADGTGAGGRGRQPDAQRADHPDSAASKSTHGVDLPVFFNRELK